MRIEWVSGISLWPSTFRRGAARFSSRAIGARIRSGTSRQAGTPRSSWRSAVSAALRVSVSATPGSSAAPCGLVSACVTRRSRSGSSAITSSSLRRAVDLLHDRRRQVHADAPRQFAGVGDGGRVLGQALDDRAHVADVHALFQQQLQHLLQGGDTDHLGDHVFDQFGGQLGHMLDQLLGLDTTQQPGCMYLHQV